MHLQDDTNPAVLRRLPSSVVKPIFSIRRLLPIALIAVGSAGVSFTRLPEFFAMSSDAQYVYHAADTRGHANHGWLDTYHSFSFANWHNPDRMHFGALRVLNDDYVAGGGGFGTHPHDNMEIVSIPLEGDLQHQDNMGNTAVIRSGDVQIMSAGTGVMHSEKNHSSSDAVRFLQIWVFPNERDIAPRYDQESFDRAAERNGFLTVVSPDGADGVRMHQNAWFHLSSWDAGHADSYQLHGAGQGVYAFVLEGEVTIDGRTLSRRDGLGVWDTDAVEIAASEDARFLLMEVPMRW